MPRLSLYSPVKSNNYRYFDRLVREQLYAGGTDLLVHKYIGPKIEKTSDELRFPDATQPEYLSSTIENIQDLLFLENRDRKYEKDIYLLRGHYQVQSLDFDLSQFGLFLSNDIVFISVHYNDMVETFGRKLIVGDVLELPHLTDYHPLDETIPVSLRRFYQVTDGSFASEGYSPTWYPHIWRIKCEPLVDSREFSEILDKPVDESSYLGDWNPDDSYQSGYIVKYGDKLYTPKVETVPPNTPCTDLNFWELSIEATIRSTISTYKTNLEINQAAIDEAFNNTPKSGFDRSQIFLVATENGVSLSQTDVAIAEGAPDPFNPPIPSKVIAKSTPTGFGMFDLVLSGDENAPNGITAQTGTQFPQSPTKGDYFLRVDFYPQKMFRFDGKLWKQISENVRTEMGFTSGDKSLRSSFINNENQTKLSNGTLISERQALSKILKINPD